MRKTSCVSASESEEVGSSKISRLDPCWIARQISTSCLPAGLSFSTRQSACSGKRCSVDQAAGSFEHARRLTQPNGWRGLAAQEDILRHDRCGASSDSWCTMAMPMAPASAGLRKCTSRPLPEHLAAVALLACRPRSSSAWICRRRSRPSAGAPRRLRREIAVAQGRDSAEAFLDGF